MGQVLWKFGVNRIDFSQYLTFFNLPFIFGFVSYGIGWIFLMFAFRKGELSVLYPIIATSYIWVSLLSMYFFNESLNLLRWTGIFIIIAGIISISIGSKQKETIKYTEAV